MGDEIHTKAHESVDKVSSELDQIIKSPAASNGNTPPKIQTVPYFLRDEVKLVKNYKPKWIAIGPIHHGNPKFELAERYKLKLAAKFIKNCGWNDNEYLFGKIRENIMYLKDCFDEEVLKAYEKDHNDPDYNNFAWMLFVDGCFILQFIYNLSPTNHPTNDDVDIDMSFFKKEQVAFVLDDLFLLENQIPYKVLDLLMEELDNNRKQFENSFQSFLRENVMAPRKYQKDLYFDMVTLPQPVHLLDLLRMALIYPSNNEETVDHNSNRTGPSVYSRCFKYMITLPQRLKDKFTSSLPVTNKAQNQNQNQVATEQPITNSQPDHEEDQEEQQYFRSVSDLMAAGISLKASKTRCNLCEAIKFHPGCFTAKLELPPLMIDDSTEPKFLNLIAYEMCPDNFETNYEITSYIAFLDSLIDYPKDVKELRSAQILHNFLGCDKDVAKVFNRIGMLLVPNQDAYRTVITQIENHYSNKYMTWIAQVINDHFSSPWTIVAFLAAFSAMALTVIQTWYTIDSPPGPCDDFCHHL